MHRLDLDAARVNPLGGAKALGHPRYTLSLSLLSGCAGAAVFIYAGRFLKAAIRA